MKKAQLSTGRIDEKASTIKEINKINYGGRYKQHSFEEYEAYLRQLNRAELVQHARTVGIRVGDDERRARLVLLNEFKENQARLSATSGVGENVSFNPKNKKDLEKVLALGR